MSDKFPFPSEKDLLVEIRYNRAGAMIVGISGGCTVPLMNYLAELVREYPLDFNKGPGTYLYSLCHTACTGEHSFVEVNYKLPR